MNQTGENQRTEPEFDETAERIESLKAGVAAASLLGLLGLLLMAIEPRVGMASVLGSSTIGGVSVPVALLRAGIALLTGFLFGVTYRYILRQDRNRQLQAGAILAFGLIRGLAQVELLLGQVSVVRLALRLLCNLLIFAVTGLALSWMMQQGWIQRCPDRR